MLVICCAANQPFGLFLGVSWIEQFIRIPAFSGNSFRMKGYSWVILYSHTWESPHFGSETFDTKKVTSEIPPFFCITPKIGRPKGTTCPCPQHSSAARRWPWCSSWFGYVAKFKRLAAGLGVISLTFSQQQLEVHRQWTWRKSGSN